MKKLFYLFVATSIFVAGCSESFDDSKIWDTLENHENRIAKLEELCKQMNTNISSLQSIVNALQNNDFITSVTPITKESETIGYTITFAKSQPITIYHGKNGQDGQNGANGVNGKDGLTPIIGVRQDVDNLYYWTLNGVWLLDDNGNKIKAQGIDGKDGQNGKDGADGTNGIDGVSAITPQFKIEEGYWYISYDNENTWVKVGKATGENGLNGENGTPFFDSVFVQDGYVQFVLNDENKTIIKLPFLAEDVLVIQSEYGGDVRNKLTTQQKRSVTHLIVEGIIEEDDVRFLADQMLALEILDLRKTSLLSIPSYAFCKGALKYGKESLREIYLPDACTKIGAYAFYGCINLSVLSAPGVTDIAERAMEYCVIDKIIVQLGGSVSAYHARIHRLEYSPLTTIARTFGSGEIDTIFCHTGINKIVDASCNYMIFEEPSTIETFEEFTSCTMTDFVIPKSVKIIKGETFNSRLKLLVIPKDSKLEKIESNVDNYLHFNYGAFLYSSPEEKGAYNSVSIVCYLPIPPKTSKLFYRDQTSKGNLYVPKASISLYENSNWNGQFANIIAIEDSEYKNMSF